MPKNPPSPKCQSKPRFQTRPLLAENPHVVNQIVERDLCVRCGACGPACPVDIVRFDERSFLPVITDESDCLIKCTKCLQVCPGEEVDFPAFDQRMFGVSPHVDSVTGIARRTMVAHASEERMRFEGTSGGFVTFLLKYMLDKGIIDGALVMGTENVPGQGWREKPFIARSADELRAATKSKYRVVPFLQPLAEMEEIEGNYAIVTLPCYVHAIRKYQRVSSKLRQRIKFVIGLYCNVAFEPYVFDELSEYNGTTPANVADLQFRYGEWPGGIFAKLQDGSVHKLLKLEEMKDEFNMLKGFYTPDRCNMCTDFSAEHADLAVGDPWLRGPDGEYLYPDHRTTVLTRTGIADRLIDEAVEAGYLVIEEIPLRTYMQNFEKSARYKRDFVPANIALRKSLGLPTPEFHRPLPHLSTKEKLRHLPKLLLAAAARRSKLVRKIGIALAQLPPALAYYRWNRKRKGERFKESYPDLVPFVDRIWPPKATTENETSGFEHR